MEKKKKKKKKTKTMLLLCERLFLYFTEAQCHANAGGSFLTSEISPREVG